MVQNRTCRLLLVNRDLLITLLTPLLLSPIPIVYKTAASKCLYMFLVMLVYILAEAIPLAMIGLLPAATFPLLGLMDAATLGKAYFTDQLLFVIGVLTISTAVERTDLHKRIVLRSLLVFGSSPYGILFGIFLISGFLSMWLPNTAMVSMMMPIGVALGEQLDRQLGRPLRTSKLTGYTNAQYQGEGTEDTEPEVKELGDVKKDPAVFATGSSVNILKDFDATEEDDDNGTDGNDVNKKSALTRCLLLSIAYGNTIGGSATMIGTIVPIIANAQLMRIYGPSSVVEFDLWIQFGFPLQLATLLCAYAWMAFIMSRKLKKMRKSRGDSSSVESAAPQKNELNKSTNTKDHVKVYIRREYAKLGDLKWSEAVTIFLVLSYVVLLFFGDLKFMKGWKTLFPKGYTSNTCITCGIAMLFFIIQEEKPNCRTPSSTRKPKTVLTWDYVSRKLPWGLLLITGGYFALAEAIQNSGISKAIDEYFRDRVADQEAWVIVLVLTVVLAITTELMGNIQVVIVMMPILASLASATSMNPLYYIIPSVFSANLTFMLPISGMPFMLAYTAGVRMGDMIKAGWLMNIICLFFLNLFTNTYGYVIFDFDTIPSWALPNNSTMSSP